MTTGPLSRDVVLRAALDLVDREGLERLGTRRLGRDLGVDPMAVHYHVPGREALLDGVAGLLAQQVEVPPSHLEWRQWLRRNLRSYRALAHRHPRAFPLLALRPLSAPEALRPLEVMLEVLTGAGFEPGRALTVARAVAGYASGYALSEITGFTFRPGGLHTAEWAPGAFPMIRRALATAGPDDADRDFTAGLDALLTGFGDP